MLLPQPVISPPAAVNPVYAAVEQHIK